MKVIFHKEKLYIDNVIISFEYNIDKILLFKTGVVVLTDAYLKNIRNVFFVTLENGIEWQIKWFNNGGVLIEENFTSISIKDDGELHVFSPYGFDCIVDIKTGIVKSSVFIK